MGWFSGKKVTHVDSSNLKLIESTPELSKDSVIVSITQQTNIADDLIDNLINGLSAKARAYYRYGKDHYSRGLPIGSSSIPKVSDTAIKQIIINETGLLDIKIYSSILDYTDPEYFAYRYMDEFREWDYKTDRVYNHPFNLPDDAEVFYAGAESLEDTVLIIHYRYLDKIYKEEVNVPDMFISEYYYHVIYSELVNGQVSDKVRYWMYRISSGVYEDLNISESVEPVSNYYPIVPVREGKIDLTKDKTTELYKTSKRALQRLGIDFDEIGEGVNSNPDIGDVDNAYVFIGLDIQTKDTYSLRYLHAYFAYLQPRSPVSKSDFVSGIDQGNLPPINTITIKQQAFNFRIGYHYIERKIVTGQLEDSEGNPIAINNVQSETVIRSRIYVGDHANWGYESSSFIVRKQISVSQYDEIEIVGMYHTNTSYGSYTIENNLSESLSEDNNNFLLPINIAVMRTLPTLTQNAVMYDSIRIVFNARVVQKIKWYQTGFFKFVLIVVAIVITVYVGIDFVSSVITAAGTSLTAAAITAVTKIAIAIAVGAVTRYVVSRISPELALLIAILAIAYGGYSNITTGGVDGLPWAEELLMIGNQLQSSINSVIDVELAQLLTDREEFLKESNALLEELDAMRAELDTGLGIDPLALIATPTIPELLNETPSQYFARTKSSGNIGVLALDSISNYVNGKLRLPDYNHDAPSEI